MHPHSPQIGSLCLNVKLFQQRQTLEGKQPRIWQNQVLEQAQPELLWISVNNTEQQTFCFLNTFVLMWNYQILFSSEVLHNGIIHDCSSLFFNNFHYYFSLYRPGLFNVSLSAFTIVDRNIRRNSDCPLLVYVSSSVLHM